MKQNVYEVIVNVGGHLNHVQISANDSYSAKKMAEAQYGAANVKSGARKIG